MKTMKSFRFPCVVTWLDGRLVRAGISGKPSLEVATPPEFKGTHPDVWSPEDLLAAPLRPASRSPFSRSPSGAGSRARPRRRRRRPDGLSEDGRSASSASI